MKSLLIYLFVFLPQALALGPDAFGDNPNPGSLVTVDGSFQSSQNYTGQAYQATWDHKYEDADHVILNAHLFTREYTGGTTMTDEGVTGGYVSVLSNHVYWENSLLVNPNANFTPLWAFATTPHYVVGANDFSMGISAVRYKVMSAGTLNPRYLREFKYFQLGAGLYATRTYDDVIAYYGMIKVNPIARQSLRIDYSGGRTIEDQGVEVNYNAISVGYGFAISGRWNIGPYASFFRSSYRNEDSFGIRLDLGL